MDWNNDGRRDLITGERDGWVRVYLNGGTDAAPVLSGFSRVKVGASDFDAGLSSKPCVADWNADGRKDLLCGEDNGKVWLLLNTGTDAAPAFATKAYLRNGAADLSVGSYGRTSPVVCDWNLDGRRDLIVGGADGRIWYFENKGTAAVPVLNGFSLLTAQGATIDVDYYARPTVADWNGDGLPDLICGNFGGMSPSGGVWVFLRRALDNDGDGMTDWWETVHLGGAAAKPLDDADGDGFCNLDEFRAGTGPMDKQSVLRAAAEPAPDGGQWIVRWTGIAGRRYNIETAPRIGGGDWQVVNPAPIEGAGGPQCCTAAVDIAGTFFLRLAQPAGE